MGEGAQLRVSPPAASELIRQRRNELLQEWEKQARREISAASSEPYFTLLNSLPVFLEELAHSLELRQPRLAVAIEVANSHAAHRATQPNFDLDQVITEYSILRRVVFKALDDAHVAITPHDRDIILEFIQRGKQAAAVNYSRIGRENEAKITHALKVSEELHRQTFEQAAVGMAHVGLDGKWLRVNQKLCEIAGYAKDELLNLTFQQITHPDDLPVDLELINQLLAGRIPNYQMEKRYIRKDRSVVWANLTVSLVRDLSGQPLYFISVVEDISRRKDAENKLCVEKNLREQFVAGITHDLRTPLAAIKTSAQIIERYPTKTERVKSLATKIVKIIERGDRMIQGLLDSSRIRAGQPLSISPRECEMVGLAQSVCDEMNQIHGGRIRLQSDVPQIVGYWDCHEIRRALENLINNAIKYGAENMPVTVEVRKENQTAVRLSVHNWGNCIPEEERCTIFEPQQRGSRTCGVKGWGVGLTLVKGIAEAHRGLVHVTSNKEHGTTFVIELPIRQ